MFACACGQLTSAWEEKPCTDCGHHAYYQDEEEFCEKERPKNDEKRLQVSDKGTRGLLTCVPFLS